MKLVRLRIRNFRCYKDEIAVDFDDMTAFIGKNDVGKSTVTDALDIFLNDGAPDKNDASKSGDAKDVDQKVNAQLRHRIRETVGDLKLQSVFVPLNDDNAKRAWEGIRPYIPVFALFKSDRPSTDQDPEAQDPLKAAVKEAIKQKEAELNAITTHVETEVKRIAQKTLEKLKEMDPNLAQQLNPQFAAPKWESLFKASITSDDDIPINKRGSGVKRLILLNFFRAKAEQQGKEKNYASVIYAIEEPETSQHPHNQRILVSALLDLAAESQVILTTHTPMLARTLQDKCLRYIHQKADRRREVLR